jgi:hypothetical protein
LGDAGRIGLRFVTALGLGLGLEIDVCRRPVTGLGLQLLLVEPRDPGAGVDLHVVEPLPRATVADLSSRVALQFGLEESHDQFGHGVNVGIADRSAIWVGDP